MSEFVRVYDSYAASYDPRTRTPKWVLEHITAKDLEGDANRNKSQFFEDNQIDPAFRATLESYKDSGYDRGHMAPAGDNKSSQKALNETFSLTNICPQVGLGFNRDYWERFERYVRDLTKKAGDVYVVTGPLWIPKPDVDGKWNMQHPMIGQPPGLIAVPTHFYKVILADGRRGKGSSREVGVGAFVMPNAPIDPQLPLTAFTVPLEPLEQLAGMRFFPNFINATRRSAMDQAALAWRQYGMQQLKPFDRVSLCQDMAALPAPSGQLLLTSGSSSPSSNAAMSITSSMTAVPEHQISVPKTRSVAGTTHLCEIAGGCKLPPPGSWQKNQQSNKQLKGSSSGHSSGSSGGGSSGTSGGGGRPSNPGGGGRSV
ncbi:hypothetical protein CEUSTIGMA_g12854.t1 [Chlamydomonas eustigma]|uniref:Endonuclease n=1 Tax=Chlamydomonas eustigma TaxID=1157962 RepID=A0A250XQV0_9CHLO|nr:hypothetical protein CEUSTIGMA_g12854.t1 [Chlamydomonas eustigma]|eukprot:GAX85438.1 hypothetical protein CEUSTIGMA_g12854.t1 [Chlamydomonas eustigma]